MTIITPPHATVFAYKTMADEWRAATTNMAIVGDVNPGAANDIKTFRRTGWVNGIKAFGGEQSKRAAMDAAAVVLAGAALIAVAKSGDLKGELRMHLMMELLGKLTKSKKDKKESLLSANGAQGVLSKTMQNTNLLSLGLAVTDAAKSGHSMMDRAKKLAEEIKENPHAALKLLLEDDATVRGTVERLDIEALRDAQKVLKTAMGPDEQDAVVQNIFRIMDDVATNGQEPMQAQQTESAIEQVLSNGVTVGDILQAHTAATEAGGGQRFMREMVEKLKTEDAKLLLAGLASLNSTNSANGDTLGALRDLKMALDEDHQHTRAYTPPNRTKKPVTV
ncbi:MAG: hypothetical protein ACK5WY_03400 [Holosporaceae bacterium]|jgi:hypothetical protein